MDPVPRLERADGRPIKENELKPHRFNITVDSVYYDTGGSGTVRCSVLLNINFDLVDAVFASALVPLTTGTATGINAIPRSNDEEMIRISGYLPEKTEWVQTKRLTGTQDTSLTPNLAFSVLSNSASLSGVGVNKHLQVDDPIMISLQPIVKAYAGSPIRLDWEFENKYGVFYPPSLKVLVIVEKPIEGREIWFPFALKIRNELRVVVRGSKQTFRRLVPKLRGKNHEGWWFQIKGKYRPSEAKAALEDALQPERMVVGLGAATRDWLKAQHS